MVARSFVFLLIGLILANPAVCRIVGCGLSAPILPGLRWASADLCPGAESAESNCQTLSVESYCSCCRDGAVPCPAHSSDQPRPGDRSGEPICQCISAGAILQKPTLVDTTPQVQPFESLLIPAGLHHVATAWEWSRTVNHQAVGRPPSGRMIRCWHSSLLC